MSNIPYFTGPFDPSLEQMNELIQQINIAIGSGGGGGFSGDAGDLTGTTLASNVVTSSLTSLGTITALTAGNLLVNNSSSLDGGLITTDGNGNFTSAFSIANSLSVENAITSGNSGGVGFALQNGNFTVQGTGEIKSLFGLNVNNGALVIDNSGSITSTGVLSTDSGALLTDGSGNLKTLSYTNDGSNLWILGAYSAATPAVQAGTVTITINGTSVTLLTA